MKVIIFLSNVALHTNMDATVAQWLVCLSTGPVLISLMGSISHSGEFETLTWDPT